MYSQTITWANSKVITDSRTLSDKTLEITNISNFKITYFTIARLLYKINFQRHFVHHLFDNNLLQEKELKFPAI